MRWIGVVFIIFGNEPSTGQQVRMDKISDCMVRVYTSIENGEIGMLASKVGLAAPFTAMTESFPGFGICAYPSFFLYLPKELLKLISPFDDPWISLVYPVKLHPFLLLPGNYRMVEMSGNACVVFDMEMELK